MNSSSSKQCSEIFQKFLNILADKNASINIFTETILRHKAVIAVSPSVKNTEKKEKTVDTAKIYPAKIFINNIITLHILMLDQPNETKKYLIKKHKETLFIMLKDFYLDFQNKYYRNRYQKHMAQEILTAEQHEIFNKFIHQNIVLNFNENALKSWIIQYSVIGLNQTTLDNDLLYQHCVRLRKKLNFLQFLFSIIPILNAGYRATYGKESQCNLIAVLEEAMKKNSSLLGIDPDKDYQQPLVTVWQSLRNEQFRQFRKISSTSFKKVYFSIIVYVLILGLINYFLPGSNLLLIAASIFVMMKVALDFFTVYSCERKILPEHQSHNSLHLDRENILNYLYDQYTPREISILMPSTIDQTAEAVTLCVYDYFPHQKKTKIYAKKEKEKEKEKEKKEKPSANFAKGLQLDSPIWTGLDGKAFTLPTTCYAITNVNFKNKPYGYFTDKAIDILSQYLDKKSQLALQENRGIYFRAATQKGMSGIVFFNKRQRKKHDGADSKMKFFKKGIKEMRIDSTLVAKGKNGEMLFAYDAAKKIKHKSCRK